MASSENRRPARGREVTASSAQTCNFCNCSVPGGPKSWEQHVQGIRHRRAVLGPNCVSVFEDTTKLSGLALQPRQPGPHHRTSGRPQQAEVSAAEAQLKATCDRLSTLLLRQLPHHASTSSFVFRRAAQLISSSALVQACQGYEGYQGKQAKLHIQADLPSLILLTHAPQQLPQLRHLSLQLPLYEGSSPQAAAEAAAMCVLLDSLRCHPSLIRLSIQLGRKREYIQLLRTRGGLPGLQAQHWSPCMRALGQLGGEHALSLRKITLWTAPSAVSPEDVSSLQAALAHREARDAVRLAVLMGTHHRLGVRSGIRRLPVHLLEEILEQAVPRTPCQFEWKLLAWAPKGMTVQGSSSSSSETSGEGSSGSSSSGDESSSGDDDSDSGDEDYAQDVLAAAAALL